MTTLYNARIVTPDGIVEGYMTIGADGLIAGVRAGAPVAADTCGDCIDCGGDLLMPGAIDTHVHFRDPGLTAKGDIATESLAAVAGGVTSYCDMPNTRPATVTREAWEAKMRRAAEVSAANYAFFIGATTDNLDIIRAMDYTRCPGVKIFLGSSTGNMLMEDDRVLHDIAGAVPAGVPLAFHAEDNALVAGATERYRLAHERHPGQAVPMSAHRHMRPREACLRAARRVHELARTTGARCVLLHLSTAGELELPRLDNLALETCPHYLLFDADSYGALGARIKCNPAIKERADRDALRRAVTAGGIDIISTDHAPHLPADKPDDIFSAASGMPGVQFSLPLMLTLTGDPMLVSRLMSANPARIYGIAGRGTVAPGQHADLVRVARRDHTITDADAVSRCGWTPYAGQHTQYSVVTTWINGREVYPHPSGHAAEALTFTR